MIKIVKKISENKEKLHILGPATGNFYPKIMMSILKSPHITCQIHLYSHINMFSQYTDVYFSPRFLKGIITPLCPCGIVTHGNSNTNVSPSSAVSVMEKLSLAKAASSFSVR